MDLTGAVAWIKVDHNNNIISQFSGKINDKKSSSILELLVIMLVIIIIPKGRTVKIYTDSLCVIESGNQ